MYTRAEQQQRSILLAQGAFRRLIEGDDGDVGDMGDPKFDIALNIEVA